MTRRAGGEGARVDPMLLPLDCLLFGPNPPAGMDWSVIGMWVCRLRKSADPCDPPIQVTPLLTAAGVWRVHDGRHRVIAAIIAGRTHIEAVYPDELPTTRGNDHDPNP